MDTRLQRSRRALDRQLQAYVESGPRPIPVLGWIRAIRDALGMSGADLARRLGVSQPTITQLERSETAGTIQLETLRRVATAMDCRLVYALVPNGSLDEIVRRRAHSVAERELAATDQSMRLEAQTPPAELRDDLIAERAEDLIDTRRLWADPKP
jgi:predicted DNA-binding mobile mystery protein A